MSSSDDDFSMADSALSALQDLVDTIGENHPFDEIEELLLDDEDDFEDDFDESSTSSSTASWNETKHQNSQEIYCAAFERKSLFKSWTKSTLRWTDRKKTNWKSSANLLQHAQIQQLFKNIIFEFLTYGKSSKYRMLKVW